METTTTVLDKINSANDLKNLKINELNLLAQEMRELIIFVNLEI